MKTVALSQPINLKSFAVRCLANLLLVALFSLILLTSGPYFLQANGSDFITIFRPAVVNLFRGLSPYAVDGFFSPPWVLLILSPLALLPERVGFALLFVGSLSGFGLAAYRMGAKPATITLLLLTPHVLWSTVYGNIDFFVPLGLLMPPQIGLFFVLSKPQAGAPIALFWLWRAWHSGGLPKVVREFAPLGLVSLAFCIPFGLWPLEMTRATGLYWNLANWPLLLPVGALLLYRAFTQNRQGFALLAAPFLAPYVGVQSLPVAVMGLLPNDRDVRIALVCLWLVWLIRGPL